MNAPALSKWSSLELLAERDPETMSGQTDDHNGMKSFLNAYIIFNTVITDK